MLGASHEATRRGKSAVADPFSVHMSEEDERAEEGEEEDAAESGGEEGGEDGGEGAGELSSDAAAMEAKTEDSEDREEAELARAQSAAAGMREGGSARGAEGQATARMAIGIPGIDLPNPGAIKDGFGLALGAAAAVPIILTLLREAGKLLLKKGGKKAVKAARKLARKKLAEADRKLAEAVKKLIKAKGKIKSFPGAGKVRDIIQWLIDKLRTLDPRIAALLSAIGSVFRVKRVLGLIFALAGGLEWAYRRIREIIDDVRDRVPGI